MCDITLPVVECAIVFILARLVLLERAHTLPPHQAIISRHHFALVVLGTYIIVITWAANLGGSHTYTKGAELRLDGFAEARAFIALPKVVCSILSTRHAFLGRHRLAAQFNMVAAASAQVPVVVPRLKQCYTPDVAFCG